MKKPKVPACSEDRKFIYCYCGKCKPKSYDLPTDLMRVLRILKRIEE